MTDIVKEAKNVLESFGKQTAQMVTLKNKVTDPAITDDQANEAKASADAWIAKPVAIKIGDHKVAEFGAQSIASAITLGPDSEKLGDNQTRNGSLIIMVTNCSNTITIPSNRTSMLIELTVMSSLIVSVMCCKPM